MLRRAMGNTIEVEKMVAAGAEKEKGQEKGKGKRVENSGNTVRAGKGGGKVRGKRLKWKTSLLAGSKGAQPATAASGSSSESESSNSSTSSRLKVAPKAATVPPVRLVPKKEGWQG